jgi:hypothetical protein
MDMIMKFEGDVERVLTAFQGEEGEGNNVFD